MCIRDRAVTIQKENGEANVVTNFSDVSSALGHLADANENAAGLQFSGKIVAVLNSNGTADWVVFINNNELKAGNQGSTGTGSTSTEDTVNGYNVNIALVDTSANFNTIATRAAMAVTKAGYKNAMPAFLSNSGIADSANGTVGGFLTAYDQNNNMVYFTVSYTNYWTVKLDGRVIDTVKHNGPSAVATEAYMKAIAGKGSGYELNGTYAKYGTGSAITNVASAQKIETGFAMVTQNTAKATLTSNGTSVTAATTAFKVANGLTVQYNASADTAKSKNYALSLGNTMGAVISGTNPQTVAANPTGGSTTLTWTINTSNVTGDVADIVVNSTDTPQVRSITYGDVTAQNNVSVKLSGVSTGVDGETVTVTVQITGNAASDTTLTITGVTGSYVMSSLSNGLSLDNGNLKIAGGGIYNTSVQYTFTVGASNAVTGTLR